MQLIEGEHYLGDLDFLCQYCGDEPVALASFMPTTNWELAVQVRKGGAWKTDDERSQHGVPGALVHLPRYDGKDQKITIILVDLIPAKLSSTVVNKLDWFRNTCLPLHPRNQHIGASQESTSASSLGEQRDLHDDQVMGRRCEQSKGIMFSTQCNGTMVTTGEQADHYDGQALRHHGEHFKGHMPTTQFNRTTLTTSMKLPMNGEVPAQRQQVEEGGAVQGCMR